MTDGRIGGEPPGAADLEALALAAMARLPDAFKPHVEGVVVQIADFADEDVLAEQKLDKQLGNPVWHLARANGGFEAAEAPGAGDSLPVTYGLLLNLVGVLGADATREQVWAYLGNYVANADPAAHPALDALVTSALAYNNAFVAPTLHRRAPQANEAEALKALDEALAAFAEDTPAEDLQTAVYEIGKREEFSFGNLRDWFKALYETLLGSSQGPRMGSFIALYGVANSRRLIAEALERA